MTLHLCCLPFYVCRQKTRNDPSQQQHRRCLSGKKRWQRQDWKQSRGRSIVELAAEAVVIAGIPGTDSLKDRRNT